MHTVDHFLCASIHVQGGFQVGREDFLVRSGVEAVKEISKDWEDVPRSPGEFWTAVKREVRDRSLENSSRWASHGWGPKWSCFGAQVTKCHPICTLPLTSVQSPDCPVPKDWKPWNYPDRDSWWGVATTGQVETGTKLLQAASRAADVYR